MPRKTLKRIALYTSRLVVSGKGSQSKQRRRASVEKRLATEARLLFQDEGSEAKHSDPPSFQKAALRILTNLGEQRHHNTIRSEGLRANATSAASLTFASQPVWLNADQEVDAEEACFSRSASQRIEDNPLWSYAAMDRLHSGMLTETPVEHETKPLDSGCHRDPGASKLNVREEQQQPQKKTSALDGMENEFRMDKAAVTWYGQLENPGSDTRDWGVHADLSQARIEAAMTAFASLK